MATQGEQRSDGIEPMTPKFRNSPFKLDYLTQPTALMDLGLDINQAKAAARVKDTDKIFLIAYPHFNVNGELC